VDGFRCDFAHYVPQEAWKYLLDNSRRVRPGAFFMAEAYPWLGSGDPVVDRRQLIEAGFDAIYWDNPYNTLKYIYQGKETYNDYNQLILSRNMTDLRHSAMYLDNHDEVRIASPIRLNVGYGETGFGSMYACYQLAPIQYLSTPAHILMSNGGEVGEEGDETTGYSSYDGRNSIFDYGCPLSLWALDNDGKWDGGQLDDERKQLLKWYYDFMPLLKDECLREGEYFGLSYWNDVQRFGDCPRSVYSFARYLPSNSSDSPYVGRLIVILANFMPGQQVEGFIRLPSELLERVGLHESSNCIVRCLLDRNGLVPADSPQSHQLTAMEIVEKGFRVQIHDQSSSIFSIRPL